MDISLGVDVCISLFEELEHNGMWNGDFSVDEFIKPRIRGNPSYLEYVKNPSLDLQLYAVRELMPYCIRYINNLAVEAQLEFIKKHSIDDIRYIKHPCIEVQRKIINDNYRNIMYISNPSREIQFEVINKDITYCQHINNPHDDLLLYLFSNVNDIGFGAVVKYLRKHREALLKLI